eukprot:g5176.t1
MNVDDWLKAKVAETTGKDFAFFDNNDYRGFREEKPGTYNFLKQQTAKSKNEKVVERETKGAHSSPGSRSRKDAENADDNDADDDLFSEVTALRLRQLEKKYILLQQKRSTELQELGEAYNASKLATKEANVLRQDRIRQDAAICQKNVKIEMLDAKVAIAKAEALRMVENFERVKEQNDRLREQLDEIEKRAQENAALVLYYEIREREVIKPLEVENAALKEEKKRLAEQIVFLSRLVLEGNAVREDEIEEVTAEDFVGGGGGAHQRRFVVNTKKFPIRVGKYDEVPTYPPRPSFKDFKNVLRPDSRVVVFDGCPDDPYRPASTPLYQTATFRAPSAESFGEYDYTRS